MSANGPPELAGGLGSALETAPPPAALPGRSHDGTHGQAPEQAALPLASVYRPMAKGHAANDALMIRAYKHVTGISRHAHTDALWGPWGHGCQGLTRSEHSWQAAVVREWVRQGVWAKQEFRDSQAYSLWTHQALRGGCPAVLTPG